MDGFTEGQEIYIRENLHNPDHLVQDDPLGPGADTDTRQMLVGKVSYIVEHKTGKKFPAILWFSMYDCAYLRAYEAIRYTILTVVQRIC